MEPNVVPIQEAQPGHAVWFYNREKPIGYRTAWLTLRTKRHRDKDLYPAVVPNGTKLVQVLIPGSSLREARTDAPMPEMISRYFDRERQDAEQEERRKEREAKRAASEAQKAERAAQRDKRKAEQAAKEAARKARAGRKTRKFDGDLSSQRADVLGERQRKYQEGIKRMQESFLIGGD